MRYRALRRWSLQLCVLALVVTLSMSAVGAYPRGTDGSCFGDVDLIFSDVIWGASSDSTVTPGFNAHSLRGSTDAALDWEAVLDHSGNPLVQVGSANAAGDPGVDIDLEWQDIGPAGSASCGNQRIRFDESRLATYVNDPTRFERLVRHEVGHIINLEHSEAQGSPMMEPIVGSANTIGRDDHGQMARRHNPSNASPNAGFEMGTTFWSRVGGIAFWSTTTESHSGSRSAGWRSSSVNHYAYIETRIHDFYSLNGPGDNREVLFDGAVDVKREAAFTGQAHVSL